MVNHYNHGTPLIARIHEVNSAAELSRIEGFALERSSPPATPARRAPEAAEATARRERPPKGGDDEDNVLPFIGEVVSYVPGQSVCIERTLSLEEDLHLADHHFVHAPGVKPLAACFPVVPMTVSLEIMAEAAACLAPGYGLIGFEDVSAGRWIALADTDELTLRVEGAVKAVDTSAQICRLSVAVFIKGESRPSVSATVLFGAHYQLSLSFGSGAPADGGRRSLRAAQAYEERHLFHGPRFQCLAGTMQLGEHGAAVELVVRSPDDMFRSTTRPQLLTDPALLDTVGQTMAIWTMEQGDIVFPVGIGKLEFYRPAPACGTRVPMRVEVTASKGKTLTADVEIQDGAGGVWLRIKDWKSWRFQWDKRLTAFRRLPTRYLLSDTLQLPAFEARPEPVCQRVTKQRLAGFDLVLLARHYLHMDEMAIFASKNGTRARQMQWLLGRIAAKDAVRALDARQRRTGETLHPAAFAIGNDEKGQPVVSRWRDDGVPPPTVSIAHCDDEAIAIAHWKPVGIDLERIAEHDAHFVKAFASESERALLADFSGAERQEWITRLWCAKETLGKLMGTGVNGAPQHFEATVIDADGGVQMRHRSSGHEAVITTVRDGNFIVAIGLDLARAG
ncbi:polyketide synthase dehydratase domain-containing protein [Paraburkholderia sp. GAS348]|uniref:polyketide synthase dehydratase domain-containing protein n=1 Tax=Paraburkholderia sp. GAS348 TaxID=3035132 RepID=UPI003D22EC67